MIHFIYEKMPETASKRSSNNLLNNDCQLSKTLFISNLKSIEVNDTLDIIYTTK